MISWIAATILERPLACLIGTAGFDYWSCKEIYVVCLIPIGATRVRVGIVIVASLSVFYLSKGDWIGRCI